MNLLSDNKISLNPSAALHLPYTRDIHLLLLKTTKIEVIQLSGVNLIASRKSPNSSIQKDKTKRSASNTLSNTLLTN